MSETRKLAAILVADVVGCGRVTDADDELTPPRLRTPRSDLIRTAQAEAFLAAHVKRGRMASGASRWKQP